MQIGIIGAGNMASALARGLGEPILCTDGGSGRAAALGDRVASNGELAARADILILAHKPAQLSEVAAEAGGSKAAVISLLAGVDLASLSAAYPAARSVTAAMPNTAVAVRQGVICLCGSDTTEARVLFERLGTVFELPESRMRAATAVGGVAPAYVSLLAEAWVDAAVGFGVPAPLAAELVLESIAGSAELLRAQHMDTLEVRRQVTSPGGVTARGLAALERAGLRKAFLDATEAVLR